MNTSRESIPKCIFPLVLAAFYLILSHGGATLAEVPTALARTNRPGERIWWIAGDAHSGGRAVKLDLAIADVNQLDLPVEFAIQLGDLVSDQHAHTNGFLTSMAALKAGSWAYVLGNHDFGPDHQPVLPVSYFAKTVNGIRFLFLCDEVDGRINRNLVMGETQREWLLNELKRHEGSPLIVFSHQPHTEVDGLDAFDFERDDVRAWFHTHKHVWRIAGSHPKHAFHQLGINALTAFDKGTYSVFLFMTATKDGTGFVLKFRRHDTGEWVLVNDREDYTFMIENRPSR